MSSLAVDRSRGFKVLNRRVAVQSDQPTEFVDVTDHVLGIVRDSRVGDGVAVVYVQHTTAGVALNEYEPLLMGDMLARLERFASHEDEYRHDDMSVRTVNLEPNERRNGHAHCQRLLVAGSESIPIVDGKLQLGTWQRIFFVELDGPRPRSLTVQVLGV